MDETESATEPGLDLGLSETGAASGAYRVLARKYRPTNFEDLIGQEPMVRTLSNAFKTGRIAQAYMLTGVRGVGKTTTARIIARALNYESMDGAIAEPTLEMTEPGKHCAEILESRHVDVIEMDAASNTGIDNIREIIESARYRPASARIKVYIIDEVHMLSKAAFNGLLKTLEEPPEHVKFIFATTEIRKVPITVLSRCQRFDLRRVEADRLIAHLASIAEKESISAEDDALRLIARAAEGSVRDALSLLDQAIAHGGGDVTADEVRAMLGVADRTRVVDLFEMLMKGDAAGAMTAFAEQYDEGADPAVILTDLARFVHLVTRLKVVPDAVNDASLNEAETTRGAALAQSLSMADLTRAWQLLLKGIPEVQMSDMPNAAADMVLVRIAYAAGLPSPGDAIKALDADNTDAAPARHASTGDGGGAPAARLSVVEPTASGAATAPARMPVEAPAPDAETASAVQQRAVVAVETFEELIALADEKRDRLLVNGLERYVRLVAFQRGRIEFSLEDGAPTDFVPRLGRKLHDWTGERWMVTLSRERGADPIRAQQEARRADEIEDIRDHPAVAAILAEFPGAEIVRVTKPDAEELPTDDEPDATIDDITADEEDL